MIINKKPKVLDRYLLAYICFRAAGNSGECPDSNKALAKVVGVHFQTVSDMVNKYEDEGLISVKISKNNDRSIVPISEILIPYKQNADRYYKQKTDSPISKSRIGYKQNTDSPISKGLITYKGKTYTLSVNDIDPISNLLIPYQQNTDSSIYNRNKKIKENRENKEKQQQQTPVPGSVDGVDDEEKLEESAVKSEGKKDPSPNPLPTAEEVRSCLLASKSHKRYAIDLKKLVADDDGYAALIEEFITQQEMQADPDKPLKPVFPEIGHVRRHFMNWLGDRYTRSQNVKSNDNHNQGKRTKSALRSTAIGQPDYRGKGSTCELEL